MKKWTINWQQLLNTSRYELQKRAPELLLGFGTAGMICTVVMAVYATPKALKKIEEVKQEKGIDKLTVSQTVKAAWKCYLPATITGSLSTGCIISSGVITGKRNAALVTACSLAESSLRDYQSKAIEMIGEEKNKQILEAVDQERLEKTNIPEEHQLPPIGPEGLMLCLDSISGRPFFSNREILDRVANELNRQMMTGSELYVSLNEFYYEVDAADLGPIDIGEYLGWNINRGLITLRYSSQLYKGRTPCLVVSHDIPPEYDYTNC